LNMHDTPPSVSVALNKTLQSSCMAPFHEQYPTTSEHDVVAWKVRIICKEESIVCMNFIMYMQEHNVPF